MHTPNDNNGRKRQWNVIDSLRIALNNIIHFYSCLLFVIVIVKSILVSSNFSHSIVCGVFFCVLKIYRIKVCAYPTQRQVVIMLSTLKGCSFQAALKTYKCPHTHTRTIRLKIMPKYYYLCLFSDLILAFLWCLLSSSSSPMTLSVRLSYALISRLIPMFVYGLATHVRSNVRAYVRLYYKL